MIKHPGNSKALGLLVSGNNIKLLRNPGRDFLQSKEPKNLWTKKVHAPKTPASETERKPAMNLSLFQTAYVRTMKIPRDILSYQVSWVRGDYTHSAIAMPML